MAMRDIPPREELEASYAETTISGLARKYSASRNTVKSWLRLRGVERKSMREAMARAEVVKRDRLPREKRESLSRVDAEYAEPGATLSSLAERHGVSTFYVKKELEKRGVSLKRPALVRSERVGAKKPPRVELEAAYRRGGIDGVESRYSVGQATAYGWLEEYGVEKIARRTSLREKEVLDLCRSISPDLSWVSNSREVIPPREIDVFSPDACLGVEVCGVLWHSESFGRKGRLYHLGKLEKALERGCALLTVFDTDDEAKVAQLLRKRLGAQERVGARECSVEEVDSKTAREFNERHHLHGHLGARHYLALTRSGEVLQTMSFTRSRYDLSRQWECGRMTSGEVTVVGGVSKLLSAFKKKVGETTLVTYADRRFGEGECYLRAGMKFCGYTPPNYWYFHRKKPLVLRSRVAFQKHKLPAILESFDPERTEWENMQAGGWDRIWDCGSAAYVL